MRLFRQRPCDAPRRLGAPDRRSRGEHGEALQPGGVAKVRVAGDEGVEAVAERERGAEVDGVQRAQVERRMRLGPAPDLGRLTWMTVTVLKVSSIPGTSSAPRSPTARLGRSRCVRRRSPPGRPAGARPRAARQTPAPGARVSRGPTRGGRGAVRPPSPLVGAKLLQRLGRRPANWRGLGERKRPRIATREDRLPVRGEVVEHTPSRQRPAQVHRRRNRLGSASSRTSWPGPGRPRLASRNTACTCRYISP